MAFAPRPRTPVRRQSSETSAVPVRAVAVAPVASASANGTIQRLLEIVTQHGVQLASLREDQEALRREVSEALGRSTPGGEKAPLSILEVSNGKVGAGEASQKGHRAPEVTGWSEVNVPVLRRSSVCSTSSGSDAGGSTSSSRRSVVPKVPTKEMKDPSSDSNVARPSVQQWPASAIPAPRVRNRSRSSSLPTTPRGATTSSKGTTPRRSASGEPTPRRNASVKESNLYEVAKPLLQPGILREKRVVTLSSLARCLKDGASPCHWNGPQTPLRCAVQAQDTEMARLLIQARADPNERDAKGVCVLHSASFDGLSDLCQTLLKARADANVADQHGQTAFFFAPSSSVCNILMDNKADVNAVNQKGQSALHLASRAGLTEVLLWMAPRISREVMEMRDIHGATAAYYARHAGISSEFLMRHKLTSEVAAESEKREVPSRVRAVVPRGSDAAAPTESSQAARSSKSSRTSRGAPLPPLLEDGSLDGEDDEVVGPQQVDLAIEDMKECQVEISIAATPSVQDSLDEEPELPTSTSLSTLDQELPPQEIHADMEVTSCYLEERSCELSVEPKDASLEVDHEQMEVASPSSSLDRADQMVTWEEDCGCPGFALTAEGAEESPTEAAPPEDGNSVASDASASDLASPSKARNKRRASWNQVFLRPLDPLRSDP